MECEYRTITLSIDRDEGFGVRTVDKSHVKKLNEAGSEGWELVAVVPVSFEEFASAVTYIFKRPREWSS